VDPAKVTEARNWTHQVLTTEPISEYPRDPPANREPVTEHTLASREDYVEALSGVGIALTEARSAGESAETLAWIVTRFAEETRHPIKMEIGAARRMRKAVKKMNAKGESPWKDGTFYKGLRSLVKEKASELMAAFARSH